MPGSACCAHRHYRAGCPGCQLVTRLYYRRRTAMLADGTWQRKVDISIIREHIEKLRAEGMTVASIARAANLSEQTVYCALNADRRWVQGGTGYPILAVQPAPTLPSNMAPAVGTTRRVRALVADGYSMSHLGRALDKPVQLIWEWAWAKHTMVAVDSAAAVRDLYDQLPRPGTSVRARNMGRKNEWAPSLAWDDATIDDPDATPNLGEPARGQDVDEVLVRRALDGHAPIDSLNDAEQVALWQGWMRHRRENQLDGPGFADFARTYKTTTAVAERLRNDADGLNSRGKPRKTTDTAAAGRTHERTAA